MYLHLYLYMYIHVYVCTYIYIYKFCQKCNVGCVLLATSSQQAEIRAVHESRALPAGPAGAHAKLPADSSSWMVFICRFHVHPGGLIAGSSAAERGKSFL